MSLRGGKTTNTSAAIRRDGLIIFSPILIEKTISSIVYLTIFRDPQIRSQLSEIHKSAQSSKQG
jgi:hypothetical protein